MPDVDPITKQPDQQQGADKGNQQQDQGGADLSQKPVRPEGFGDAFNPYWNDDKGADFAKLGEDFSALTALKAEHDARLAGIPEKLEDYEIALPEGFKTPEGMQFEIKADDPLVVPAREFAKKHNLTKDGFKELVALQAQAQINETNALTAAATEERNKLGTKGTQRIEALTAWMTATIGNDLANTLLPMMFTAKQIEAFEKVMDVAKAGGPKLNAVRESDQPPEITADDWNKMSLSQRIAKGRELDAKRSAS